MRWTVTAVLVALLLMAGPHARAADPTAITLSCDGTFTDKTTTPLPTDHHQPEPIEKMGVVMNLDERTVSFMGYIAPISTVDAAIINFNGEQIGPMAQIAAKEGYTVRIDGTFDRVTGHMTADTVTYETKRLIEPNSRREHYDVLCKATNRVF